jgi:hypothetical protein
MRFTPGEVEAMNADPMLMQQQIRATAQGKVNLDSAQLPQLLAYAVSEGFLDAARPAQIMADGSPSEV